MLTKHLEDAILKKIEQKRERSRESSVDGRMQQRHWKTAERGKRRKSGYSASPDLGHVVNNHMTVIWNRWSAIRTIKISSKNLERRILARLSSFYLYQKRK